MDISDLHRFIEPIKRRLYLMVGKGTVERVDDSGGVQRVQASILRDEVLDQLERAGVFGITSNPQPGAACIVLFLRGDRGNGIVVATEDERVRPTGLAPGETALYNAFGAVLKLLSDGKLHCDTNIIVNTVTVHDHIHPLPGGPYTGPPVSGT